jgi:hypothetical protein
VTCHALAGNRGEHKPSIVNDFMSAVGLVLSPMLLPEFTRTVVVSVFGEAKVSGTMHIKTPIEKIHHWLAPPILREGP